MENQIENPFSNYGRAISGKDFIGRSKQILNFEGRVIYPRDPNHLALIGFHRIGKTSIIEQTILKYRDYLLKNKKIPVKIDLGTVSDSNAFFIMLVSKSFEYFEENNLVDDLILKYAKKVNETHYSWESLKGTVERFFDLVFNQGYRMIFFIDEFDFARILFKDKFYSFQEIRVLGSKVCFLTTSRRSIKEIELYCVGGSNLDLTFEKQQVSMFDDDDIGDFYNKMSEINIQMDLEQKQRIEYYCGRHPFLLTILGFEIVESFRNLQPIDIDLIFKKQQLAFIDYYNQLIKLLKEDNSFTNLLQIIFGPQITIKEEDILYLSGFGLIIPSEHYFVTFSAHFQGYLKLIEKDENIKIETWRLISLAEKGLRNFIHTTLSKEFNNDWLHEMPNKYGSSLDKNIQNKKIWIKNLLIRLESQRNSYVSLYGSVGNLNLLDYTYFDELFQLIRAEWKDIFEKIFNPNNTKHLKYWEDCFKLIGKVRNPVFHQNMEVFPDSIYKKVDENCKELLEIIDKESKTVCIT